MLSLAACFVVVHVVTGLICSLRSFGWLPVSGWMLVPWFVND